MKRFKMNRRNFLKSSSFITGSAAATGLFVADNPELEAAPAAEKTERKTAIAQCPYCGVGCGTVIQTENGRIVSMRPDKDHPTNYGLQCIKGLTAAEPIYVDRMEGDPYVRKDVWEEWQNRVMVTSSLSVKPKMPLMKSFLYVFLITMQKK